MRNSQEEGKFAEDATLLSSESWDLFWWWLWELELGMADVGPGCSLCPFLLQGRLQHPCLRLASTHQQIRRGSAGRLRAGLQLEQVRRGAAPKPTPPNPP